MYREAMHHEIEANRKLVAMLKEGIKNKELHRETALAMMKNCEDRYNRAREILWQRYDELVDLPCEPESRN